MFTQDSIRRALEKGMKCDMCQKQKYYVHYDGMGLCYECYKKHIDRQADALRPRVPHTVPVVFINCDVIPFLDLIIRKQKVFETRTRDTLRALVGQRVYLAETGKHHRPLIRCSAVIRPPVIITDPDEWDKLRTATVVGVGSQYDWKPETKVKYCYPLAQVFPCQPFTPPEGKRHGYVWMEYNESEV